MSFYKGTGLYGRLASSDRADSFRWAAGDAWCLVYGTADAEPRVGLFVEAVPDAQLEDTPSADHETLAGLLRQLGSSIDLPVAHMRFASDQPLEQVLVRLDEEEDFERMDLDDFAAAVFSENGLPTGKRGVVKKINKQSSSSYHDWQRASLGNDIVVSDVDLFRITPASDIAEIVEVKRSFKDLDEWQPYRDDYNNFRLLAGLANPAGVPLTISYHVYTKGGVRKEITDELALFDVHLEGSELITPLGRFPLDQFIAGAHL